MYKCANGHFVPLYLSKIGTLNFGGSTRFGTRLILLASTRLYASNPSTILKCFSMSSSFRWASLLSDCSNDSFLILFLFLWIIKVQNHYWISCICPRVLSYFVRLCRGWWVAVWEPSHLRHRLCLRILRVNPCGYVRCFLLWFGWATLLCWPAACALSLTRALSIAIISTICPCWSWLAFSNRSILASLSSAIFFVCRRVRYRGRVVC